jgi:hypothetical protein
MLTVAGSQGMAHIRPVMPAVSKSYQGWELQRDSVGIGERKVVGEGVMG